MSTTAVNRYGSVLQDAVLEGKTDFVRLLLEHGWGLENPVFPKILTILFCRVDAKVGTDEKDDTPIKIALERDDTEIAVLLCEAIGEEVPDKVKLQQLSKAMYKEDKEEAKKEFSELLRSLTSELVRCSHSKRITRLTRIIIFTNFTQITIITIISRFTTITRFTIKARFA